jgi:hypothetical protein
MKRFILRACLIVGCMIVGSVGCQQTDKTAAVSKPKPASNDPTAWSEKDVTKGGSGSDSGTANGLSKSSNLPGTLSPEAQDIERSLGVGR